MHTTVHIDEGELELTLPMPVENILDHATENLKFLMPLACIKLISLAYWW